MKTSDKKAIAEFNEMLESIHAIDWVDIDETLSPAARTILASDCRKCLRTLTGRGLCYTECQSYCLCLAMLRDLGVITDTEIALLDDLSDLMIAFQRGAFINR